MVRVNEKMSVSNEFLDGVFQATIDEAKRIHPFHRDVASLECVGAIVAEAALIPIAAIIAKGTKGVEEQLELLCDAFVESIRQIVKESNEQ